MRVLFDENVHRVLRRYLPKHFVMTAVQMKWDHLADGLLLAMAQDAAVDVMVTADQGIFCQQNNRKRLVSLVVITSTHRLLTLAAAAEISAAIDRAVRGSFEVVPIRQPRRRPWGRPSNAAGMDGDA